MPELENFEIVWNEERGGAAADRRGIDRAEAIQAIFGEFGPRDIFWMAWDLVQVIGMAASNRLIVVTLTRGDRYSPVLWIVDVFLLPPTEFEGWLRRAK